MEDTHVSQTAEYDAIAAAYQDSKRLPFREYVERYTLFDMLGDVRGKVVLDVACGEGFYTRLLKQAGAAEVTGVDISAAMIQLAEKEERRHPLGCRYLHRDVAQFEPSGPVDVVVAMYLLSYASSRAMLCRFGQVCYAALRPGGRLVGIKDNSQSPLVSSASLAKLGLLCPGARSPWGWLPRLAAKLAAVNLGHWLPPSSAGPPRPLPPSSSADAALRSTRPERGEEGSAPVVSCLRGALGVVYYQTPFFSNKRFQKI